MEDVTALLRIYGDPRVVRFVDDGAPLTASEAHQWLAKTQRNYDERGYGMFAVLKKGGTTAVGFCGLVHPGGQAEADLKYAFAPEVWGRGYATEAGQAMMNHAWTALRLGKVIATVDLRNDASAHVLSKCGFRLDHVRMHDDGSRTNVFVARQPC